MLFLTTSRKLNNVVISDNCLPFFILYHYFLSSSTINCVNLRSDLEFKLIFTDAVLDFESITQHPDNKNISQQMKHAQRTEKYIRLIFNSYISDDDFFQKSL
jgi:hypothetical protein